MSITLPMVAGLDDYKSRVIVSIVETDPSESDYASSTSSIHTSRDELSKPQQYQSTEHSDNAKKVAQKNRVAKLEPIIYVNTSQQTRERIRLAYTYATSTYKDLKSFYSPMSDSHRFSHRVVDPLFTWKGENNRVIAGKSLGATIIQDKKAHEKIVIHAGSHNYAGFYRMTQGSEQVHKLALDQLPIAPQQSLDALSEAFHHTLGAVFKAEFCFTTSTGYASNLLAFSAILRPGWLCIMDAKSHNSMHVGAYVSGGDRIIKYRHNDMSHLEDLLKENSSHYEHVLVAVEGLFSMDGTIPPLDILVQLKRRYGFVLLVDEAHSLLSIGKTGKGCVELWNDTHPDALVHDDLVDIRTAVLSKTLGAIGGMVCGKRKYSPLIGARYAEMRSEGLDPVLTSTMIQCLCVLGQPTLLKRRLARMREMSRWARSELKRFGIHVYGDAVTPLLPIHTGRASKAAKLSHKLRRCGVLATPVSMPAVPFWQSRIRVCLSADHTDEQINKLVWTIITCTQDVGIIPGTSVKASIFSSITSRTQAREEVSEASEAHQHIESLVHKDATAHPTTAGLLVRQAGHEARQKFGLAAGGARWISGTFSVHIEVEKLIEEILRVQAALSYADSYVGLLSTISALCRPLLNCKSHKFFLPTGCARAVLDGLKAAPKSTCPHPSYYDTLNDLSLSLESPLSKHEQVTIYLSTSHFNTRGSSKNIYQTCRDGATSIKQFVQRAKDLGSPNKNITILLHDTESSLRSISKRKDLVDIVESLHRITKNLLVYGDFMSNFGVPGAYLAGSQQLVEELRYSSRGYMFSTASLPFMMGIVKCGLENSSVDVK